MANDFQTDPMPMPEGAYFDDDEILRDKHGDKLPDGLYETADGGKILYEGNFDDLIIPE